MLRWFARPVALLALVGVAFGCDEVDAKSRSEAERVVLAVKALRDAENEQKGPRLTALRATECTLPDVCALKEECGAAYDLYVKGLDAVRAVKKSLASDAGASDALSAARLLETAERDVASGKEKAGRCAESEAKVRLRYKLD
ncbi:MAG: hypothetical protein U0263_22740 [Polyangiaceae bacterium]